MFYPKVSIVTPILKEDKFLFEYISSVFLQKEVNIELIIVSSKEEIKLIEKSIRSYNLNKIYNNHIVVQYVSCDRTDAGTRRNLGIKKSNGKYILFADADDYFFSSNSVLTLVKSIEEKSGNVLCSSCLIRDNETFIYRKDLINYRSFKTNILDFQNECGFYRFIYLASFLKNRNNFKNLLRFQDSLFLVELLLDIGDFYVIPNITYVYRKGHKFAHFSIKMYQDHLNGVFQVLNIAYSNKMQILFKKMLKNIIISTKKRKPIGVNSFEIYKINYFFCKNLFFVWKGFVYAPLVYILAVFSLLLNWK